MGENVVQYTVSTAYSGQQFTGVAGNRAAAKNICAEKVLAVGNMTSVRPLGIMHAIRNFGPKWLLYKGFFFKNPSCLGLIGGQHSFLRTNERSGSVNSLNTPMMIHNQITK